MDKHRSRRAPTDFVLALVAVGAVVLSIIALQGPQPPSRVGDFAALKPAIPRPAADVPPVVLPDKPNVMFFGDSWTAGQGASTPDRDGYVADFARDHPTWKVASVPNGNGTGYLNPGPDGRGTYQQRLAAVTGDLEVNLLIIQGGLNDEQPYLQLTNALILNDAVKGVISTAREKFPNAQIILLGAASPLKAGSTPGVRAIDDRIKFEAIAAGVPMISPVAWFDTEAEITDYIGNDQHPNDLGHAYYADELSKALGAG